MEAKLKNRTNVLMLLLSLMALAVGQSAWAENTWTVENPSGSKFTITRSGDLSKSETVYYRTVSLTAVAGYHFNDASGQLTFDANQDSKDVTVSELTPSHNSYKFQDGSTREYRFEVTDQGGFLLADCDRIITTGSSINTTSLGLFNEKTGTIQSGTFTVTDKGYKQSGLPKTTRSSSFYTTAQQEYLATAGAQLQMTLEFQAKEVNDGYQYLQILTDNTTGCDNEKDASKGNPGTPSLSRYMAGFEIYSGKLYKTDYKTFTFPVTSVGNDASAADPWGIDPKNKKFPLSNQKFNTSPNCRASNGKLILPTDFQTLAVRFDASGDDEDDWTVQDLKAKITAVDNTAPTVIGYYMNSGLHCKGNTIYVSVAFSEIVKVTGTPKLNTNNNWGTLTYIAGSGTNVLTFCGTIGNNASSTFSISSLNLNGGTIKDLKGNAFSGSISHNFGTSLTPDYDYPITYDLDGGTADNPTSYKYITSTITLNAPTKDGNYYFAGWTGSNGDEPQKTVTIPQYTHGALSYTAHWTQGYSVFFYSNGGSGVKQQQDFNIGEEKALTTNTFTHTNFIFTGWNTKADGTGTPYSDGQIVSNLAGSGETVTLYAQWTPDYTLWNADDDHDGTSAEKSYIITTTSGLNLLAELVNNGNTYGTDDTHPNGYFFKLGNNITYSCSCKWDNSDTSERENNFAVIGDGTHGFDGTFDGNGMTIRGIRVSKIRDYIGLFGYIKKNGTVKNVTINNTRLQVTNHRYVGSIAGLNLGTIENCHASDSVCLVSNGNDVAGICGVNGIDGFSIDPVYDAKVKDCTSSVTIKWRGSSKGGIVAYNYAIVQNCFAERVQINDNPPMAGAIYSTASTHATFTNNYYNNCSVRGEMTNIGKADPNKNYTSTDVDGAMGVAQITLGEGVSTNAPTLIHNNKTYYYSGTTITLTQGGQAQDVAYIIKKTSDQSTVLKTASTFMLPGYDVSVSTTDELWDGKGTEEEPYLIKDENEFTQLIVKINGYHGATQKSFEGKHFKLMHNLSYGSDYNQADLNDDGTASRDFKGIFNGNGKYISGITICPTGDTDYSIFGDLNGGTIKDLTIKNATIYGIAKDNYGFVCRNHKAGTIQHVTVQNCTISTQGEQTVVNNIGGICANLNGGTITNCTVDNLRATVLGTLYKRPCINDIGGLVGKATGGTVSNSTMTSTILNLNYQNSQYVGGFVGEVATLSTLNSQLSTAITNCTFEDSRISCFSYAGGIVGKVDHPNCRIESCRTPYSTGSREIIYVTENYAGGIVGWFNGNPKNSSQCLIRNCENTSSADGKQYVGGIAGYANNCRVAICYNYCANNCDENYLGGIVGKMTGKSSIIKCFNTGAISINERYKICHHTGGIVGYIDASHTGDQCIVEDCFNSYEIYGINCVGGIVGTLEGNATLTRCYNTGVVKGIAQVGGLIGLQKNASAATTNCYSAGKVQGSSMTGAVCGYATSTSTPAAKFSNCYYDSQMVSYKAMDDDQDVTGITAKTHASMVGSGSGFGLGDTDWTYSANHYPQLNCFYLAASDASMASTIIFPLTDTQNTTNLHVRTDYSSNPTGDCIEIPDVDNDAYALNWKTTSFDDFLHQISGKTYLYTDQRGIYNMNVEYYDKTNKTRRTMRNIEVNIGISAEQPILIEDTLQFRQLRDCINTDQEFGYSTDNEYRFLPTNDILGAYHTIPHYAEGYYFKLKEDMWMVAEELWDICWRPIAKIEISYPNRFRGYLDGDGKKVTIKCKRPTEDYLGLFGYFEGRVKNVKMTVSMQNDDILIDGHDYVGAIAGYCHGTIDGCSTAQSDSTVFIPTIRGNNHVGTLVGRAEYSKIINCNNAYCYVRANENVGYVVGSYDANTIFKDTTTTVTTPYQIAINNKDLDNPAGDKNTDRISAMDGKTSRVVLPGRVLYMDGCWNTLCLPFNLTAAEIDASPLAGAILKEFDRLNTNFDATTGTLNINFKDATSIVAGTPYLIKWEKPNGYVSYDYKTRQSDDIMNPEFPSVLIDNSAEAQARMTVTSADGKVSFKGTYSLTRFVYSYGQEDKSVLFLGTKIDDNNTPSNLTDDKYYAYLYYPEYRSSNDYGRVPSCRAYFQLNDGLTVGSGSSNVRAYNIDFGEDSETSLSEELRMKSEEGLARRPEGESQSDDAVYDLSGRKINSQFSILNSQLPKGIYIYGGKKIYVK
ncbi:MAG: InlB B-repeat-containing protein [Bacteroidaceae bacterium]|nr:InlB B-repeat-containing protein [Bacteroidaceae bacterium]